MLRVRVEVKAHTPGLDKAEQTLVQSLNTAMDALGRRLQKALRGRTRYARGDERRNITYEVRGQGFSKALTVFGNLIQLWIDEYGLRPGVFPPWKVGSRLYSFVNRLGLERRPPRASNRHVRLASHVQTRRPGAKRAAGVQRGAAVAGGGRTGRSRRRAAAAGGRTSAENRKARATQRLAFLVARAIFERGIKAGKPIAETFAANRASIIRDVSNAFKRAVSKINRGT